jgi:pimeloyl-ACP methyl ester carboxylesterase
MLRPRFVLYLMIVLGAAWFTYARQIQGPTAVGHYAMGSGPTIVVVHGLGSGPQHWLPMARLLARDYRVVLADLPGHGVTPIPRPFSMERVRASLDVTLSELSGPIVLVGHSVGGLLATAETIAHPDRVRALVLIETALKPQMEGDEAAGLLDALDTNYDAVIEAAYTSFGHDSLQGQALYEHVRAMDPSSIRPWIELAMTADLSQATAALSVPVLVVLADRSWPKNESWSVTSAALGYENIPNLKRARIDDSGHFVMLDHPEQLARLIAEFARHPASGDMALGSVTR